MKKIIIKIFFCFVVVCLISCSNETNMIVGKADESRPSKPINAMQVRIGDQIWMTKNLNVSKYRNGDIIPEIQDRATFLSATTGAWCHYANNSSNGRIYGKLYNFYAVTDPRGLAPEGWHIPSITEWNILRELVEYRAAPIRATTLWHMQNGETSTNNTGFTCLPGGGRFESETGDDFNLEYESYFWTSSHSSITFNPLPIVIYGSQNGIYSFDYFPSYLGLSVRCVKD